MGTGMSEQFGCHFDSFRSPIAVPTPSRAAATATDGWGRGTQRGSVMPNGRVRSGDQSGAPCT